MQELRRRMSVAWRCAPAGRKLLAATVLLILLGGVVVAVRAGAGSPSHPVAKAAASLDEPAPVVPTLPAAPTEPATTPTAPATADRTAASAPASGPVTRPSAAPSSGGLETASAPDSAVTRACSTYRTSVEPIIRQAVENDDLEPAAALLRAGSEPQSPWSQLTSAATLAALRAPDLQQHIQMLGHDITSADPSLTLTGLGSDLDAIDLDCGDTPG